MNRRYFIYPAGFLLAIGVSSILLLSIKMNPIKAYTALLYGAFGNTYNFGETLTKFIPLLFTALAFSFPSKSGFWNIGAEGQLHFGALAAFLIAFYFGRLPNVMIIPMIFVASFLAGTFFVSLPLITRIKFGINEIFSTMIYNFIAILFVSFMCIGPLRDPNSINPQTRVIPASKWFFRIMPPSRIHIGLILPIFFVFILYLIDKKTIWGYKIRLSSHPKVASYAGINISKIMTITCLIGGGLAGLAGMNEVCGTHHLLIPGFSRGYGFAGIIIAILAKQNFLAEIPVALFFSALLVGGESMQSCAKVPFGIIFIIQALIVLSILMLEKLLER